MYLFISTLIIYVWKSNIWYNNKPKIIKRLKWHLVLMVYFILYKQLKMAYFFKTKQVSEASCYAMQRLKYRGPFGFKHPWVERTNRGVS